MHVQFFHKSVPEGKPVAYWEGEYHGPYHGVYVQNDTLQAKDEHNNSSVIAHKVDGYWVEADPVTLPGRGQWTGLRLFANLARGV